MSVLTRDMAFAVAQDRKAAGAFDQIVTIRCSRPGMRRCGIEHPAEATYPAGRWTLSEILRFIDDPAFQVVFDVASVAPGATTADAIRDQGAGPSIPDLGAKPDGNGPSVGVFDMGRINAIAALMTEPSFVSLGTAEGEIEERSANMLGILAGGLGFEPSSREVLAAILSRAPPTIGIDHGVDLGTVIEGEIIPPASSAAPVDEAGSTPPAENEGSDAAPDADRVIAIRAALPGLVTPDDFTASGAPKIDAVERLTGFKPTRAEIVAAQAN